ncbi:uncharacterized protein LOC123524904 [Mercenaria mercenaria]|uniref:uncharacterized protein LOC123524904 n=1 Tax=Mercenaria mercenaria TaxID=6596 RepID=UPI00234F044E|nr:uncharacterized protein LOC123524904 [Mercenaria mercenaria]XP_045159448.2 uncharacterized protein LOC123524904 [Mercenaria mercenaria]
MDEIDDAEGVPLLVELEDIRVTLREEAENRTVDNEGCSMYECLANTIQCVFSRTPVQRNVNSSGSDNDGSHTIEEYTNAENIQKGVAGLLATHSKQFQSVLVLLVEDVPVEVLPNNRSENKKYEKKLENFYNKIISDCSDGSAYQTYINLCIYAAATCINTPIYILSTNETGHKQWSYFQPLFRYEGQPECVISYVTMYMLSEKAFHKIESHDISAPQPEATGLVGMYLSILEDTPVMTIDVPDELQRLSDVSKSKLCYTLSREIVLECCKWFMERRLIQQEDIDRMTVHRATRLEFAMFVKNSQEAFIIVCQVLLKRRERTILTPYLDHWNVFVKTCDFLEKYDALVVLDSAIYERNISVSSFVDSCKTGGQELDERRKKITTTVIASSSVGIVSGGMVIAGLILAPFSFGASLGLSIAGGAIGVGTGVAAGTARAVEAVKQNTKLKDIKEEQAEIQKKENAVAAALEKMERCFQTTIKKGNTAEDEGPGISRRGFLAVGSALRASHSVAGIALAAVRLGTTAAAVSASVLGPLSLVFDVAFLAEAAHNKATGDKTNAGELLQGHAETVDMKCKIFNNMLRGNCAEQGRLFHWS